MSTDYVIYALKKGTEYNENVALYSFDKNEALRHYSVNLGCATIHSSNVKNIEDYGGCMTYFIEGGFETILDIIKENKLQDEVNDIDFDALIEVYKDYDIYMKVV